MNKYDIVILGNSHGDGSFCPRDIEIATGLRVFQLSHKGMSTEVSKVLWIDYLRLNSPPKVLFVEATGLFDKNETLGDLKSYSYWSNGMADLLKHENFSAYIATKISNLFYWNGEIFFRSLYFIGKSDQNKVKLNNRVLDKEYADKIINKKSQRQDRGNYTTIECNLSALYDIIIAGKNHNCQIYIIFTPWYPQYASLVKDEIEQCINNISNIIGNNAQVINYLQSIKEISAFEDLTHLNYNGTKLFLNQLINDGVLQKNM
ncbi:MAG: hypothetical protein ABFC94_12035 [Syntrophomonas sp.]